MVVDIVSAEARYVSTISSSFSSWTLCMDYPTSFVIFAVTHIKLMLPSSQGVLNSMFVWPEAFSVDGADFYCISGANSYSSGLQPLIIDNLYNSPDQFGLNVSRRFYRFPFAGLGRYQIIVQRCGLRRAMVMKFSRPLGATIEKKNVANLLCYYRKR